MKIYQNKSQAREAIAQWRRSGEKIAAIPTMGALHPGHLSLLEKAKEIADRTVTTIFVNPLQFSPNEDFARYPRNLERDIDLLRARGCDLLFAPDREELFASDFSTNITVGKLGDDHCALTRPHFFDGVATIVAKLLLIIRPHAAIFGEKDYQQLLIVRRMTRDLDIDVDIVGAPTIREADGLAISSRNQYLSTKERRAAPKLYAALTTAARKLREDGACWREIRDQAIADLEKGGFGKIEYFNLIDAQTLARIEAADRPARILAAAWLNKTRLIDNVAV